MQKNICILCPSCMSEIQTYVQVCRKLRAQALAITLDAWAQLNNELCFGGQTCSGVVQISQCKYALRILFWILWMQQAIQWLFRLFGSVPKRSLTDFCLKHHLNVFLLFCFIPLQMECFGFLNSWWEEVHYKSSANTDIILQVVLQLFNPVI